MFTVRVPRSERLQRVELLHGVVGRVGGLQIAGDKKQRWRGGSLERRGQRPHRWGAGALACEVQRRHGPLRELTAGACFLIFLLSGAIGSAAV